MKPQMLRSVVLLIMGLAAVGIVAGVQQNTRPDDLSGGTTVGMLGCFGMFGMLAVLLSTQIVLTAIFPTPDFPTVSEREGRLGGILIVIPLLIGILNVWIGKDERSPLYIPALMLSAVGVSAAFWFLVFCIGHLLARRGPALVKAFWVVALILGNLVVIPLYWYLFIWRPHLALPSRSEKSGGSL
jgi:hypothetical protein